jgi:MarR family transcriptional regulator, transcriptional regulator for hemolysin
MADPRDQFQQRITSELIGVARLYRREVDRRLVEHDLTDAKAMPILHIARSGDGMRQGVLADELGLEGPSLVRLLDQLCAAELVQRRDDPADKRAKTLHITDAGRAVAKVAEDALQKVRGELLADVSFADLAATVRTLSAFKVALDEAEKRAQAS